MICLGVAYFGLIYLNLLSLSIYCFHQIRRILAIISLSIFFPLTPTGTPVMCMWVISVEIATQVLRL